MGAGRGNIRRTGSAVSGVPGSHPRLGAQADYQKWHDFVTAQKIEKQSAAAYYLSDSSLRGGKIDSAQIIQVMAGMLCDFVEVGALTLPPGRGLSDYKMRVGVVVGSDGIGQDTLFLMDQVNGKEEEVLTFMRGSWFTYPSRLGDWTIREQLLALELALRNVS